MQRSSRGGGQSDALMFAKRSHKCYTTPPLFGQKTRRLLRFFAEVLPMKALSGTSGLFWLHCKSCRSAASSLRSGSGPDVLACLLELRADSRARTTHGTALHNAAAAGNCTSIELFLDMGLDIEDVSKPGNRPIHGAAAGGQKEALQLLLQRRAAVDPSLCLGATPLIIAALHGHVSCCRLLLEHRAEVNKVGRRYGALGFTITSALRLASPLFPDSGPLRHLAILDGCTALQAAAMIGHQEVVKLLLEARADASVRHRSGVDARELARRGGHTAVEALLGRPWTASLPLCGAVHV